MAEPQKQDRVKLQDVINYEPQQYLSKDEQDLIQVTFKNNPRLINIIRKIFIPTITDSSLPIEEANADPFLNRDWSAMPMDEAKILIVARQDAVKYVIGGLIKLQVIANGTKLTPMEEALKRSQDTNK